MKLTDPIADYLTRIRNAITAEHDSTQAPLSSIKKEISVILKAAGYIEDFRVIEEAPQGKIEVDLSWGKDGRNAITGIRRISKPGCRSYTNCAGIPQVLGGLGVTVLSTSKGLMTGQQARRQNVGGEILFAVW